MDFKEHLQKQLGFIERSCASFDEGNTDEAIRIAVSARVLLDDTEKSISLLSHLGVKDTIHILTTTEGLSETSLGGMAFGAITLSSGFSGYHTITECKGYLSVDEYLGQIIFF